MNYVKIYNNLIKKARLDTRAKSKGIYYEAHHIIPRCIGGLGETRQWKHHPNIVLLTGKEHWLAHLLLIEIFPENKSLKLAVIKLAYKSGNQKKEIIVSGKQYERLRKEASLAQSFLMKGKPGHGCSKETKLAVSRANKGKTYRKGKVHTLVAKQLIGIASKDRISGNKNPMKNSEVVRTHSGVWKIENNPSKIKSTCPFCGTIAGKGNYAKWHGNNCKKNESNLYIGHP